MYLIFCFVVSSRTSRIKVRSSSDRGLACVAPDLLGKLWFFSSLKIMSAAGFLQIFFMSKGHPPLFLVYWELLSWISVELCQMAFYIYWYGHVAFLLGYINWSLNTEPALHAWKKRHLIVVCSYYYWFARSGWRFCI